MRQRAIALRRVTQLAGVALEKPDELLEVGRGDGRVHGDQVGGRRDQCDGCKVLLRPRHLGEQGRVAHVVSRVRDEQRVPVGRRTRHKAVGDVATRAAAVVDDDGLAEDARQRLGQKPRGAIDQPARRIRHDQCDRLLGESLRTGDAADAGQGQRDGQLAPSEVSGSAALAGDGQKGMLARKRMRPLIAAAMSEGMPWRMSLIAGLSESIPFSAPLTCNQSSARGFMSNATDSPREPNPMTL